jgi:hypothetical protein
MHIDFFEVHDRLDPFSKPASSEGGSLPSAEFRLHVEEIVAI